MKFLHDNQTFELVKLPKEKKALQNRWIYRLKHEETSQSSSLDLEIEQMDMKTAFLYGDFKDEIYMEQPEDFMNASRIDMLKKQLAMSFSMKDLGSAKEILGIRIEHDRKEKKIWLSQEKYIETILHSMKLCYESEKPILVGYTDSDMIGDIDSKSQVYCHYLQGDTLNEEILKRTQVYSREDPLDVKSSKKFPLASRLVVLAFSVICGVYIFSICSEQVGVNTHSKLVDVKVFKQQCPPPPVEQWELPYLNYPDPQTFNREECACNPVRLFCIVSMQRSGSGWFETLLNSHMNVSSNGEIFSVVKRRENVSSILMTLDKVYNLDWFTSASKNECSAAVGFKWMLNQGLTRHHEEIVKYFERRNVSVIFLFRRNLLRRMVSVLANIYDKEVKLLNGTHKSHVHSTTEANILAQYRPRLNVTLMISELKLTEETTQNALVYFKNIRHIVLYYEDLLNNRTKILDVQEFLRVPYRDLQSHQVRIHTAPLSMQIENWEEVQKALNGTPYQKFLYSD
nr:uncharacterized protein LOC112704926 [Arachis hypogaea]